jgi:hypothetical protein
MNVHVRTAARAAVGLTLVMGGLTATAPFAAAECDGPLPSFRDALPTADRVVIGEVIAIHPGGMVVRDPAGRGYSRFALRVELTPRGTSERVIEIRDLPTQPCASPAYAHLGDRVAIGFGATDFTPPVDVNVIAWLDGRPMDYIGVETTTVAAIYRRLGLEVPDTSTAERPSPARPSWIVVLLAAGLIGGAVAFSRPLRIARR